MNWVSLILLLGLVAGKTCNSNSDCPIFGQTCCYSPFFMYWFSCQWCELNIIFNQMLSNETVSSVCADKLVRCNVPVGVDQSGMVGGETMCGTVEDFNDNELYIKLVANQHNYSCSYQGKVYA